MVNVIIKSDERRAYENKVMRDFGVNPHSASAEKLEQAEAVAARSAEAVRELKRMEGNRR
ncbi:hypothetical protein EI53_01243 [Fusobacterium naviforme]|nr:hypothetical protein F7P78_06210 [Fusobacterium naviforme]PSL10181.1 hypothetical protein EI53_01243 [Fusobacterium naviforme]STO27591.1 Uncharacterised protein [Fusobacterium naviforme]